MRQPIAPHFVERFACYRSLVTTFIFSQILVTRCYRMGEAPRSQSATGRRTLELSVIITIELHLVLQDDHINNESIYYINYLRFL